MSVGIAMRESSLYGCVVAKETAMIFALAGKSGQVASDLTDDFLTVPAFDVSALGIVAAALAVPERPKEAAE